MRIVDSEEIKTQIAILFSTLFSYCLYSKRGEEVVSPSPFDFSVQITLGDVPEFTID